MSDRENRRNYYRILHVQPDAPGPVLKSSYRALMQHLEMHPDRGGDHWNAALVNEAFAVLSDPVRRARYDSTLDIDWLDRQRQLADDGPPDESAGGGVPFEPSDAESSGVTGSDTTGRTDGVGTEATDRRSAADDDRTGRATPAGPGAWRTKRRPSAPGFMDIPTFSEIENSQCLFCGSVWAVTAADSPSIVCAECKSPLALAGTPQLEDSGRRAARRVEREGAITYYVEWPQAVPNRGKIVDLSPLGMQFTSRTPIDEYRMIKLEGALLDAVASVANCRDDGGSYAIGVRFYTVRFNQARGTFLSTDA